MMKRILQKMTELAKTAMRTAIQGSGTAALYLCASAFLAATLLAAYLTLTGYIDKAKWYRALAILQGVETVETQKAERDIIAEKGADAMLEQRAIRVMERDYFENVTQAVAALPPPPAPPTPEPPPPVPSDADKISAFEKRVNEALAKAGAAGLGDLTEILAKADPDMAKEVIRKFWKDGQNQRVLQILSEMEERERNRILFSFRQSDPDELKDLTEILQRIGDGIQTPIIKKEAEEP